MGFLSIPKRNTANWAKANNTYNQIVKQPISPANQSGNIKPISPVDAQGLILKVTGDTLVIHWTASDTELLAGQYGLLFSLRGDKFAYRNSKHK